MLTVYQSGGDVKVREVGVACVVQEDVVRLHVPVQDLPGPEEVERQPDLRADEPDLLLAHVMAARARGGGETLRATTRVAVVDVVPGKK